MSCIELKDIRIYANHGCLSEEEKIGSHYLVNLRVECDLSQAAKTDALQDTIDYVGLNNIVKKQMACLLYTSPSPRDVEESRMPSSA